MSRNDEYRDQRRKFNALVRNLDRDKLEQLTEALLMKRHVDGGIGRVWDAPYHLRYEDEVINLLSANADPHASGVSATNDR